MTEKHEKAERAALMWKHDCSNPSSEQEEISNAYLHDIVSNDNGAIPDLVRKQLHFYLEAEGMSLAERVHCRDAEFSDSPAIRPVKWLGR